MKLFFFFISTCASLCFAQDSIITIAFGSCSNPNKPLPILGLIPDHNPDLFILLGDNIYADTENMCALRREYKKLGRNKHYKNIKKNIPIIATWDDHDYGMNDIGRHYKKKKQSKEIFLKFFDEQKNSERRQHEGIYTSYYYEMNGKKLQIILLDNRTFRDDLLPYDHTFRNNILPHDGSTYGDTNIFYQLDYMPHLTPDSTMLGETQWKWLEGELSKPADVRIIGSSTQFSTQYNGYETWANFPHEQQRMLDLINSTHANGVFFISGDVHYSELSKLDNPGAYPIYDLTSSGLTEEWRFATPNKYRVGNPVMENNFGIININWNLPEIEISLEVWDITNTLRIKQIVKQGQFIIRNL